jgi:hypothetical protein
MGTTTFSGPIKAGTIKETTGTTLGVNIKNTGQVVMAQTTDFSTAGGAQTATVTDIVIPAASQIIDIVIDVPVAVANATCVLSIGDTVGGNATFINQFSLLPLLVQVVNILLLKQVEHWFGQTLVLKNVLQ